MNTQKGYTTIVIVLIITVIAVGGYLLFRTPVPVTPAILATPTASVAMVTTSPVITATPPSPSPLPVVDTSNWKTYQNSRFTFHYPAILSVRNKRGFVAVDHAIAYPHINPCNMRDATNIEELTDFDVSLELPTLSLSDAIRIYEPYAFEQFWKDGKLELSPYFIDEFNIGILRGYRITSGVEGCGRSKYFFPLSQDTTLVVERTIIAEFSSTATTEYQKYLKVPGIIRPEDEEKLFIGILSTFRIVK